MASFVRFTLDGKTCLAEEGAPNGTLTTAETQTAGKGRRGRVWKSPEGTSVSMSLLLYPDLEPAKAPMLTLSLSSPRFCSDLFSSKALSEMTT